MKRRAIVLSALALSAVLLAACDGTGAATSVKVSSTDSRLRADGAPDWRSLRAVAGKSKSEEGAEVLVILSTYDFVLSDRPWPMGSPGKGEGRLELTLTKRGNGSSGQGAEVTAGRYEPKRKGFEGDRTCEARIELPGGIAVLLSEPRGSVEVASVTPDEITGTFDLKTQATTVSGRFRAPLKNVVW